MIHSYSNIYNLGHAAIADLFKGPVIVEEKIDGSQISFGIINGELQARSKGAVLNIIAPDKMFAKGIEVIKSIENKLKEMVIFRGEYLAKPKHNTLCYDRVPQNNIIIFDIEIGGGQMYITPQEKKALAASLGFECVPELYHGMVTDPQQLRKMLQIQSCLGGQKVEGVVIKPEAYDLYGRDKKVLMGKFVSEEFKEIHSNTWQDEHGTKSSNDIIQNLTSQLATPARWNKAVIHLKERGAIEDSLRDIGRLIPEVPADIEKECEELIKEQLYKWAWPQLKRSCVRGLPEWYKNELMKKQFEDQEKAEDETVSD